ncbi:MAG: tetratricopeptide repeat protein, partial [Thermoanaerobaculia bacterium]|nr:tetratricopeptide repeat protein [Thermoanaerobaculia bacterium]
QELKRRNVWRVAATYAVVAFVVAQVARLLQPALLLPDWFYRAVVVAALLGFPIALVIAWAFELTPEGVRRTPEAEPTAGKEATGTRPGMHTGYKVLLGLGLLAAAGVGTWYLVGAGGEAGPEVTDRSIAVLPFETLGDTAATTFTEGLHNDLITRLQRVSELTVTARPSVMRYKGTAEPLATVAEELGARWLVTAAVQSAGGQVQVNPRLVDPRTGSERWSASYRRELAADELFALQEEITRQIAGALEAELSSGEGERIEARPTEDLEAYRLYVQGRRELAQRSGSGMDHVEEAVRLFRAAIEQDSSFALAWTGLADAAGAMPPAWWDVAMADSLVTPDVEQAFAARRALELDPDLAEAHASLGLVHLRDRNAPAAREELERAIDLKPSYWEAHYWLGELYLKVGRPERALEHLKTAVELNPRHALARHWLYDAYNWTGQAEESLEEARRQEEMGLEETSAIGGQIRALVSLGRLEEARRMLDEQVAEHRPSTIWGGWFRAYLVEVRAAQGDTARARQVLEELQAADAEPQILAWAHIGLGETDRALEQFDRLEKEDWAEIATGGVLRGMASRDSTLRDDPRYRRLVAESYRAWGLSADGRFPSEIGG